MAELYRRGSEIAVRLLPGPIPAGDASRKMAERLVVAAVGIATLVPGAMRVAAQEGAPSVAECITDPAGPELYGPTDVNAQTANQGLSVALNSEGTVSVLRWPSPSYYDQVRYRAMYATNPGWVWPPVREHSSASGSPATASTPPRPGYGTGTPPRAAVAVSAMRSSRGTATTISVSPWRCAMWWHIRVMYSLDR